MSVLESLGKVVWGKGKISDLLVVLSLTKVNQQGRSLALVKVESRAGDQERDFLGPLRASMRGERICAAPLRNFQ